MVIVVVAVPFMIVDCIDGECVDNAAETETTSDSFLIAISGRTDSDPDAGDDTDTGEGSNDNTGLADGVGIIDDG